VVRQSREEESQAYAAAPAPAHVVAALLGMEVQMLQGLEQALPLLQGHSQVSEEAQAPAAAQVGQAAQGQEKEEGIGG
jgi:hypothetical protein